MPEVPHDATVALRLELGRMTDKANALEGALRKEGAAVIAEAIKDAAKSVAENDRLKQDNVRLSAQVVGLQVNALNDPSMRSAFVKAAHKDYDDLKAEVDEARRGSGAGIRVMLDLNNQLVDEIARLKAENERLRKAGDAVCESPYALETDPAVIEWRAAKEGNLSV